MRRPRERRPATGDPLHPSDPAPLRLLHVVRRYGPVGGMERYVWELTHALHARGHAVAVLCERCYRTPADGIAVHAIGEVRPRPRWLASLRFGARVARWVARRPEMARIIHSHERTPVHHLTSFHGPPFATIRARPLWRRLSLRIAFQLYQERRELRVARLVVPVSATVGAQLGAYYPELRDRLTAPVIPGVRPPPARPARPVPPDGGVIGFAGKEWRRKGLELAVAAVARLRTARPQAELWVAGPDPAEVAPLFEAWAGGYRLLGWRDGPAFLAELDVLLHPARAEPFGMVITEAMAARVPVVVSDNCGASAEVGGEAGRVLSLADPVAAWSAAVEAELARPAPPPAWRRGWDEVAAEYETVYRSLPVTRGR